MKSVVPCAVSCAVLVLACSEASSPARPIPATLEQVSGPIANAVVGTSAGTFAVRVKDAAGNPISGVVVSFTVSMGGGLAKPATDTTQQDGTASTAFTVGTVPGANRLTATVGGLQSINSQNVTADVGSNFRIAASTRSLRYPLTSNSSFIGATVRDTFGNVTGASITWTSRNPSLVSVTPGNGNNASVQVQSRPGQTYIVATAGSVRDSIPVAVLDASSTACTFIASPTVLAIGASQSFDGGAVCIRSEDVGAEYVVVSHYGATTGSSLALVEVTANGILSLALPPSAVGTSIVDTADAVSFETGLRNSERLELPSHVDGARLWAASRPVALSATVKEGDVATFNVSASGFCSRPDLRGARVAAITRTAIVLADTGNPAGGFTDAEYREFAVAMDTLVSPVDTIAFGSPSDIDGNGRVVILFTKAVNELTPRGTQSGVVLGFFYARDLLPRVSPTATCPGSNVSEMFYMLVPDPGAVASDARSKDFVRILSVGTIAHEYQHLINASRRLYASQTPNVSEELWLNEGLSHIAEELVFYRASGLAPRQNVGANELQAGSAIRAAYDMFGRNNLNRYQQYLRAPDLNSPLSPDDGIATRGAAWAFLRYLADRAGASDGDLWYRIANSPLTGIANLDAALSGTGLSSLGVLRDWSVSVLADDNVAGSVFQQPSWNFVTAMPATGLSFTLAPATPVNGLTYSIPLRAGGASYSRFGVTQNQEALVQVTGGPGRPVPPGLRLLIVRTK